MNIKLNNKKVNIQKLLNFGFKKYKDKYIFQTFIFNDEFLLEVTINNDNSLNTKLTEKDSKEIYTLHLIEDAQGDFVGKIREEYNNVLQSIEKACFENDIFKFNYSKKVIEYVRNKYSDELEFLWEKFSNNAIVRRKDNQKWYMIIMRISKNKLGIDSGDIAEVLDLRTNPENINSIIDNQKYFPGYHMNKKHWITVLLDGSVSLEEIYEKIDMSYILAKK